MSQRQLKGAYDGRVSTRTAATVVEDADSALAAVLANADADPDRSLTGTYATKRVADVLLHLHAWHVLFNGWMAHHDAGHTPAFPAEGYEWADLDALNEALYVSYRDLPYDAARVLLLASHRGMCDQVAAVGDDALNDPGQYPWVAGETLGDVAHECLAGHYAWALSVLDGAPAAGAE